MKSIIPLALLTATASAAYAAPASPQDCKAAAAYSASHGGVSFLVMRDGKIICEDYPNGGSPTAAHALASGTKSFTGISAAAAAQDGFLSLDEKVSDTITEWKADPQKSKITIREMIGLISGLKPGPNGAPPPFADAINFPMEFDPGTHFHYGPAPFQVFGEVMKRKLAARGGDSDPLHYLTRRVLDPLGVKPAFWRYGQDGNPLMPSGSGFDARTWVKVGEFMRLGGKWNGKQLVDPKTLAELTHSGPVNPSYGISWWVEGARNAAPPADNVSMTVDLTAHASELPPGIFLAAGAGIQRLIVIPSAHLVVVRQTGDVGAAAKVKRRAERRAERADMAEGNTAALADAWSDAKFVKLVLGMK